VHLIVFVSIHFIAVFSIPFAHISTLQLTTHKAMTLNTSRLTADLFYTGSPFTPHPRHYCQRLFHIYPRDLDKDRIEIEVYN